MVDRAQEEQRSFFAMQVIYVAFEVLYFLNSYFSSAMY